MSRTGIVKALTIVFVSSFCTMALELVAGRLLAPYIGVSLYTWTSIIGVVLAGISLGNYLGGKLADRAPAESTLGWLLFASGLACLLVVLVTQAVTVANIDLPLVPKIVFLTTAIFFLPCCLLGMVSPLVVKLRLQDIQQTGSTIGTIYAFSTLGSIAGTFATGFVLIALMGTRTIVLVLGATLVLMALLLTRFWRGKEQALLVFACLLALAWQVRERRALDSPCLLETDYYCIRVSEDVAEGRPPMKRLVLDHLVHSFVVLGDPTHLEYGYERVYAEMARYTAGGRHGLKALFIGGGGYTFPRYLEAIYPESAVVVVEIDPAVTRVAYSELGLPFTSTIRSYNEDARQYFMRTAASGDYDLVLGDAFNDLSVPYHLTTVEFAQRVKQFLRPDGLYLVNVIDSYKQGRFVKAFAYTLSQVFPYVYLTANGAAWEWDTAATIVLVASATPIDAQRFRAAQQPPAGSASADVEPFTSFLAPEQLAAYLQQSSVLLTDDYVPVDNMIAPLFVQRGF